MLADEKKQEILAAIAQMEDEAALEEIATFVHKLLKAPAVRKPLAPPGFARVEGFWMADDFDEPLEDFKDY